MFSNPVNYSNKKIEIKNEIEIDLIEGRRELENYGEREEQGIS